jgi:cation transport regulator
MPYATNAALPAPVRRHLPRRAQDIYREAFNHAWERYGGPGQESRVHRIAWAAVKRHYLKIDGMWAPRPPLPRRARELLGGHLAVEDGKQDGFLFLEVSEKKAEEVVGTPRGARAASTP